LPNQIITHDYSGTPVGTSAYVEVGQTSIPTSQLRITDTSGELLKAAIATPLANDPSVDATLINQTITYAADLAGTSGNSITVALADPGSENQSLSVGVVSEAITVNLASGPNIAALATLDLTVDVVLTSVAKGPARNTNTFTTQVVAAAANPLATVIVTFTGTAAAITCTVTPNDGTHNSGTPVNLTTANLVELINTGLVAGKTVTIVDASSRRILQTATGGGPQNMVDGGEGDGVVGTFSGGANYSLISTAQAVVSAINADVNASALVDASTSAPSTVLAVLVQTNLSGGTNGGADFSDPVDLCQTPVDGSVSLPLGSISMIPSGSKILLKAISAQATSGFNVITVLA
jgi:hypothetical protein